MNSITMNPITGESGLWYISPENIEVNEFIGEGPSAKVYKGILKYQPPGNRPLINYNVAIKQWTESWTHEREKSFHSYLNDCRNTVSFYGICAEGRLWSVYEFADNTLFNLVTKCEKIAVPIIVKFSMNIATGLTFLHKKGIIHGNLKDTNVLLISDERGVTYAQLTDFAIQGLAFEKNGLYADSNLHTTRFRAPESFAQGHHPDQSSDMYSCGMIFWELDQWKRPFAEECPNELKLTVMLKQGQQKISISADCPTPFAESIISCCQLDPSARPKASEIQNKLATLSLSFTRTHLTKK